MEASVLMSAGWQQRQALPPIWSASCLWLLATLFLAGCGFFVPPRTIVFPVRGRVLVNGQPAEKAEVTLYAKNHLVDAAGCALFPHARVNGDGTFAVETYGDADGAPPGEYSVTVTWPTVTIEGGEEVFGPDRLQGRYGNASSPAATIVVQEHENNIPPIQLR